MQRQVNFENTILCGKNPAHTLNDFVYMKYREESNSQKQKADEQLQLPGTTWRKNRGMIVLYCRGMKRI